MKANTKIVLSGLAAAMVTFSGCGGGGSSGSGSTVPAATPNCESIIDVTLSGDISSMTLDNTKIYGLDGKVRLTAGSTLDIPAGTVIAGCTPASYLIVKPGATINAVGTQAAPVTFTSQKDVQGLSSAGQTGEWGGLVILGNAFTDHGVVQYEAGDVDDTFGSTSTANNGESSGSLDYVLIKHTGFEVEVDKELNGLSLGGVGSGTNLTNIAIVGGSDDGMEIWGGAVNVTGLYVTNAKDDSVDTDLGYIGTITDVYVKQYIVDKTNNHDSAAIETGNDTNLLAPGATTFTLPTIVNFTAEVTGAGIYMKNDAGLNLSNAKFTSSKSTDTQMATYRTQDVVDTGTMNITTTCMQNAAAVQDNDAYLAIENTKDTGTGKTASTDLTASVGTDILINDTSCTGATLANIWKGTPNSNAALE